MENKTSQSLENWYSNHTLSKNDKTLIWIKDFFKRNGEKYLISIDEKNRISVSANE